MKYFYFGFLVHNFFFILKWYLLGRLRIGRKTRKKKSIIEFYNLLNKLPRGSFVIDVGANIGEVSKICLDRGFVVEAFEPDPVAIKELTNKLSGYKKFSLFEFAVGLSQSKQKLYRTNEFNKNNPFTTNSSSLLSFRSGINKPFVIINVMDFIGYLEEKKVNISLLKMDIEGSEIPILNRIIDLNLHKKIQNIFVETHEIFSHELGLETAKLKLRIKKLNIDNINLDWV